MTDQINLNSLNILNLAEAPFIDMMDGVYRHELDWLEHKPTIEFEHRDGLQARGINHNVHIPWDMDVPDRTSYAMFSMLWNSVDGLHELEDVLRFYSKFHDFLKSRSLYSYVCGDSVKFAHWAVARTVGYEPADQMMSYRDGPGTYDEVSNYIEDHSYIARKHWQPRIDTIKTDSKVENCFSSHYLYVVPSTSLTKEVVDDVKKSNTTWDHLPDRVLFYAALCMDTPWCFLSDTIRDSEVASFLNDLEELKIYLFQFMEDTDV